MSRFVAAGLSFLLAVLWFDLMFDVQTRGHTGEILPPEVLASISAYYRRVTTEAHPMNRLVSTVMLLTILAICLEIREGRTRWWVGWGSLAILGTGVVLALTDRSERGSPRRCDGYARRPDPAGPSDL